MGSPQLLALALALAMFPLVGYMICLARYEYKQRMKRGVRHTYGGKYK